jgi:hypothetical protein
MRESPYRFFSKPTAAPVKEDLSANTPLFQPDGNPAILREPQSTRDLGEQLDKRFGIGSVQTADFTGHGEQQAKHCAGNAPGTPFLIRTGTSATSAQKQRLSPR